MDITRLERLYDFALNFLNRQRCMVVANFSFVTLFVKIWEGKKCANMT